MKDKKLEVLEFIKQYNQISVKSICKELGISDANIYRTTTTLDNMVKVKKEIKKRVIELLGSDIDV